MASAVFEGTSLVNMFVRGCWVNGIRRLIVSRRGDEEEFFEIRTEWSDRSVLYLHRSLADLGRLWQRLRDAFPEDRPELARGPLRQGAGRGAHAVGVGLGQGEPAPDDPEMDGEGPLALPVRASPQTCLSKGREHFQKKGAEGIVPGRHKLGAEPPPGRTPHSEWK